MARENAVVRVDEIGTGEGLRFTVPGEGSFEVRLADLSQAVRDRATLHGIKQRISDKAAIPRDTTTGASATPEQKFAAMRALAEHYSSGTENWELRGAGSGQRDGGEIDLVLRAIAQIQGVSAADVRERAEARCADKGEKLGVWTRRMANAEGAMGDNIRRVMDELRPKSKVDAEDEIASLMGKN